MHKKFEINRTKIKGGCQSGIKVVTQNSKSNLPLADRPTEFEEKKEKIMHTPCIAKAFSISNSTQSRSHSSATKKKFRVNSDQICKCMLAVRLIPETTLCQ